MKGVTDNERFWKKTKPFFSDKGLQTNNIIIKGKNTLATDSLIIVNAFNNHYLISQIS